MPAMHRAHDYLDSLLGVGNLANVGAVVTDADSVSIPGVFSCPGAQHSASRAAHIAAAHVAALVERRTGCCCRHSWQGGTFLPARCRWLSALLLRCLSLVLAQATPT